MTVTSPLIPQSIAVFLLMMTRIGTMMMFMPGFGGRSVPTPTKVVLSGVLALLLVPFTQIGEETFTAAGVFATAVARELLIGLVMGIGIAVVFGAIEMASSLIGLQVGLNLQPVFNPSLGAQQLPVNTFYMVIAALIFFGANGHHLILLAMQRSFQTVPVGTAGLAEHAGVTIIGLTSAMFVDALRIALPVAGTLLVVDACLGVLNRMVPQMHVFFVGLPIKIFVGFAVLLMTMPFLVRLLSPMLTRGLVEAIGHAGSVVR